MNMSLYQEDFYRWTVEQSKLLRSIEVDGLDAKNLAEEIASLGRQERKELRTHFNVVLGHLLKWHLLPQERSKLWQVTIDSERREIHWILRDSPSLKDHLSEIIKDSYEAALYGVWQRFVSEKDTSLKPSRHGHFRDHFFNFLDFA
jgi:hypothetical protein